MEIKQNYFKFGIFFMAFFIPFLPFRYIAVVQLISFFLYILEKIRINEEIKLNKLDYAMGAFYLILILATAFSETLGLSIIMLLYYTAGLTMYWIISKEFTKKDFIILGLLFLASSVIVSFIGIKQYISGDLGHVSWLDAKANPNIKARAYSVFNNPNVLGEYLLVVLMINAALVVTSKKILRGIILLVPFMINVLALLLTFSRGAWGGFALAVLLFIIVFDKRWLPLVAILGMLSLFVLPDVFVDRILTIFISSGDSSTDYRFYIWSGAKNILKDYWLFGTGLGYGSFSKVYSLYRMGEIYAAHSHNVFYEILLETGVFGMLTFVYMLMKSFVLGINQIINSHNNFERIIIITGIASLSGLFLHGMVENTLFDIRIVTLIWVLFGFIMFKEKVVSE
ncbi:MAG: O-antigen ligase family protein [Clostridiales bacterium]|nr:O-antigen ligase family protein [Clostridiales bacterium]